MTRKPHTSHAGHDLGMAKILSFLPHAPPSFTDDAFGTFRRCGLCKDAIEPFSASKSSSGLFGPQNGLRFARQLRGRRSGHCRSSWIGSHAVHRSRQCPPLAHPFSPSPSFVGLLFSQSRHCSTAVSFFFFFVTLLLSSFWTSCGHRCRPFSPPVLAFNFYRA